MNDVQLPPLLKKFSWTRAAPYKEERYFRGVSDSIGNNYSPHAMDLNLKSFTTKRSFSHGIYMLRNMILINFVGSDSEINKKTKLERSKRYEKEFKNLIDF